MCILPPNFPTMSPVVTPGLDAMNNRTFRHSMMNAAYLASLEDGFVFILDSRYHHHEFGGTAKPSVHLVLLGQTTNLLWLVGDQPPMGVDFS